MTDSQAPQPIEAADQQPEAAASKAHPWAELGPESFSLLRLAPLPTDRSTGARPLRFVQLGRVERQHRLQSLLRLTVQLPGQRRRDGYNLLEVWADHRQQSLRFGPEQGLHLEPENRGLGRFLLAQGIAWAQQHYPSYSVEGAALPARDVLGEAARARRDHCLQAQGFFIEYLDPLQLQAQYSAPQAGSLHSNWNSEKLQRVELLDAASMLQQADLNLHEQEIKIRKLDERLERLKREDGSLRFTITCLVAFCLFQAALLIWIAAR